MADPPFEFGAFQLNVIEVVVVAERWRFLGEPGTPEASVTAETEV
jgi:hypothetical protein